MRTLLNICLITLFVSPFASCAYFGFLHYPQEVQRFERGEYSLVIEERPSQMLFAPELVFGSLHNNTSLDVALLRGGELIERKTLVEGRDLPIDHLPVKAVWGARDVVIREPQRGETVRFEIPRGGA